MTIRKKSLPSTFSNFQDKEIGILDEYVELVQKHKNCPELLLYNFARAIRTQDMTKLIVYYEVFKKILDIPGDILEIGVLEGQSLFSFAHFSEVYEHRNYTRRILGFDDFNGYNLPNGHRIEATTTELLEDAVRLFNKAVAFNQFQKITLVKGDIEKTLPTFVEEAQTVCSLLILHRGVYDTDRAVLEAVWPRMPKGAIVLTGSFNHSPEPGSTKVIDDVLGIGNLELHRFPFATKYCYIKKE